MINLHASNWFSDWFYSPNFIEIGQFAIAKYAVCILLGVVIAYFVCTKEGERLGIKKNDILDCIVIVVPCCIVGARVWYMCTDGDPTFINYVKDYGFFPAILYIFMYTIGFMMVPTSWSFIGISGLAIHGGILVAFILSLICCHLKGWDKRRLFDMLAPGLLMGQMSGRWGNFFNKEAHGTVIGGFNAADFANGILTPNLTQAEQYATLTQKFLVPKWIANNMYIYNAEYDFGTSVAYVEGYQYYHPTFLYEFLWNGIGLIMYFIFRRTKFMKSGLFAPCYLIWYGIGRFFIESIRMDSLYTVFFNLKMAQVTSIIMIIIGILIIIYLLFIKKGKSYHEVLEMVKAANNDDEEDESDDEPFKEDVIIIVDDTDKNG